jgi:S-formylglutathione hydrolase FrmB
VLELGPVRADYRIHDYLGLKGGPGDDALANSFSVAGNIDRIVAAGKEIILSCGESDRFYPMNVRLKKACDDRKLGVTWITGPGDHNYDYWGSAVGLQLAFFAARMKTE